MQLIALQSSYYNFIMSKQDYAPGKQPTYNKLFLVGAKSYTEDEISDHFSKYGTIEKVWKVVKNGNDRGIMYVLYDKISSAALALQDMNGKSLPGKTEKIKILFSQNRDEKTAEPLTLERIYIKNPKKLTEEELTDVFQEYGDIDHVHVRKNKSGKVNDYAFVTFKSSYFAALAVENCAAEYRVQFAQKPPAKTNSSNQDNYEYDNLKRSHPANSYGQGESLSMDFHGPPSKRQSYPNQYNNGSHRTGNDFEMSSAPERETANNMLERYPHVGISMLEVSVTSQLSSHTVYNLFNIVPGMETCEFNESSGYYNVKYSTSQCAAYAKDRINNLELTPGMVIKVRHAELDQLTRNISDLSHGGQSPNSLHSLVKSVQSAAEVLKQAGLGSIFGGETKSMSTSNVGGNFYDSHTSTAYNIANEPRYPVTYLDIHLPGLKAVHSPTDNMEKLYVSTQPHSVDTRAIRDCFARFGAFVKFDYVEGCNYGYAFYTSKESARALMDTVNMREMLGSTIKITPARSTAESFQQFNIGQATLNAHGDEVTRVTYCDFMLPTNKSLVHRSTEVAKRLFFNTYPRVKLDILHDVFSRFGDLIDASYVRDNNYGFAKFASEDSADSALWTLNQKTIAGSQFKLYVARPPEKEGAGRSDANLKDEDA